MQQSGSYNGWSFGTSTWGVRSISGLDDLPPIRSYDVDRAGDHGSYPGSDLLGPRQVILELLLKAASETAFDTAVQAVAAATAVQTAELPLYFGGGSYFINARPRRRSLPRTYDQLQQLAPVALEFLATDPRYYGATVKTATMGLGIATSGLVFPATFPTSFGSGSSSGSAVLTNAGTFATRPRLTITGPVDNPIVDLMTTPTQTISLVLSLSSTDTLVIDLKAGSIILNGTASRRNTLAAGSVLWELPPGSTTVRFRNNGAYQAAAALAVSYYDAYL